MGWKEQSDNRQVLYDSNDNLVLEVGDDSSLYNRAGTQILSGNGGSIPVAPEDYGAIGDGTTDDYAALKLAFASGKNVRFRANKTYLSSQRLNVAFSGQIIDGNGSTLKRPAQAAATTATTVTSGVTTTIVLAGATNPFKVNDEIVLSQGGATGTYSAIRQISSINGQSIVVNPSFNLSFSGTTNVYLAGHQIYVAAAYDNVRVTNVTLEGNVSNWTLTNWGVGVGIYIDANKGALVDHCRLNNIPGDAMETNNSTNAVFFSCVVENVAARGFSFGGSGTDVGNKIIACRFYNCETNANGYLSGSGGGANDGHGNINFSLGGNDALIHGCQIDTGITGIGGGDNAAQSGVTISDNVIRTMSGAAIEGINSATPAIRYEIVGNRIYNAVRVNLNQSSAFSGAVEWHIADNLFVETDLKLNNYQNCAVRGNRFYSTGTALTFLTLDNSGGAVGVQNTEISGNRFYGGSVHISLGTFCTGLAIANNILYNAAGANFIAAGTAGPDVLIQGNVIVGGAATTTGTNGITINGKIEVRNNVVDLTTAFGNNGIQIGASASQARVIGNTVTCRTAVNGISITAGAASCELRDNTCNSTYSDSGTNTIKSGNRISPNSALSGRAVLVAGTVTVNTGEVLTADNVLLSVVLIGGTIGVHSVGTIVNKTSFVINSSNAADTSTIYWKIDH